MSKPLPITTATDEQKEELRDVLTTQIDLWLEELGYEEDGAHYEEEALRSIFSDIIFGYLGPEGKCG